eukprot:tig00000802_g4263.t1
MLSVDPEARPAPELRDRGDTRPGMGDRPDDVVCPSAQGMYASAAQEFGEARGPAGDKEVSAACAMSFSRQASRTPSAEDIARKLSRIAQDGHSLKARGHLDRSQSSNGNGADVCQCRADGTGTTCAECPPPLCDASGTASASGCGSASSAGSSPKSHAERGSPASQRDDGERGCAPKPPRQLPPLVAAGLRARRAADPRGRLSKRRRPRRRPAQAPPAAAEAPARASRAGAAIHRAAPTPVFLEELPWAPALPVMAAAAALRGSFHWDDEAGIPSPALLSSPTRVAATASRGRRRTPSFPPAAPRASESPACGRGPGLAAESLALGGDSGAATPTELPGSPDVINCRRPLLPPEDEDDGEDDPDGPAAALAAKLRGAWAAVGRPGAPPHVPAPARPGPGGRPPPGGGPGGRPPRGGAPRPPPGRGAPYYRPGQGTAQFEPPFVSSAVSLPLAIPARHATP